MFNVVPRADVPGFRVGLADAVPGFRVDDNIPRSSRGVQPDPDGISPFGYGPYGGEQRTLVAPSMITPTALFGNPVGGLLPLHFDQRGLMAARGSQDLSGEQSSMMDADRSSEHDQCVERCYPLLLRPKPFPGSDLNQWDYLKCYNNCMSE
jgi:hypothetical protein